MKELEQVNSPVKLSDEKFDELLKEYGVKMMVSCDINQTFKYTKNQIKKLIKEDPELKDYFEVEER